MNKKTVVPEEVPEVARGDAYIATVSTRYGDRVYAPGEILDVEEGMEVPGEFMPMMLRGPNGSVPTGPHYFALREVVRHGKTFKPGELWPIPFDKEAPPFEHFAPIAERNLYERVKVGNIYELCKKPQPVADAEEMEKEQ